MGLPATRPALSRGVVGAGSNPIDAFLADAWEKHGLRPQPPADQRLLLRRVYLDLIGLPPSGEDLDAFEADRAPDAYEKVVDRLLASPQYGERWGRHWMDVWRYSDWWGLGEEVRNSQKHIWHWRDWIIESLNADKGAWVSTTLPAPSPSTMRMTMVRGPGLTNSAITGTPSLPIRNVTATRKRSSSSGGCRCRAVT